MQPFKCPVCEGRGKVPNDFYDKFDNTSSELKTPIDCRACGGIGILWNWDSGPVPDYTPWVNPGDGNITLPSFETTWISADILPNEDNRTISNNPRRVV